MAKKYLLLSILIILGFSCNPVKQIQKSKEKYDAVVDYVLKQGVCTNDTIYKAGQTVYLKGKDSVYPIYIPVHDTLPKTIYKIDTTVAGTRLIIDSLGNILLYAKVCIPDTVKIPADTFFVRDVAFLTVLENENDSLKLQLAQEQTNTANEKGKANKWFAWFIGVCVACVGSNFLWAYLKFKT